MHFLASITTFEQYCAIIF